jgi:lipoprotein-anchoring transpeptidase ErfK/SrfK
MPFRCATFALLILITGVGAHARAAKPRSPTSPAKAPPRLQINLAAVNDPGQAETIQQGDRGSAVLRAQILLDRAHFSCGQIDANFGTNLQKTVSAFQNERGLPATGAVDSQTWASLNGDTGPALTEYLIAPDDEKGPFVKVPATMQAQAKLHDLGYSSPLDGLAEKFHTSPILFKTMNPGSDFAQAGQKLIVPNVLAAPPGAAAKVVVSKSESSVRAFDASGKLIAFYVATIGSEHDPLPIGPWKIKGVAHHPFFHYNARFFWDADQKGAKATIRPGPRNPVGAVWIDLSKPHYGIHGTPDPSLIGHATSHGCIRLTNWDALELAAMVKPGTEADLLE